MPDHEKPFHLNLRFFNPEEDMNQWEQLIQQAPMSTWMHSQQFLSYHGDRFRDRSLILQDEKNHWIGLLPAAQDPESAHHVVSHPGLSYAGLIHTGSLKGEQVVETFRQIASFYKKEGYQILRYKVTPSFYHQRPSLDDSYALFRLNANRYRCDLTSLIDLHNRPKSDYTLNRALKQAKKNKIQVSETEDSRDINNLWQILDDNLNRKHKAKPVHSVEEILLLKSRFPESIRFIVARQEDEIVAGFVLFIMPMTVHMQYSAASMKGYETYALNPVAEYSIALASKLGCRYFDFGISTEKDGRFLNEGLYRFKSKFGASGALHEFYDLTL